MIEMIESLAWPFTVIVVALIFKKPLSGVAEKIRHVKYKEFELKIDQDIRRIEEKSNIVLPVPEPDLESRVPVDLSELASISPKGAIVEAWRSVEYSAKQLIRSKGHEIDYDIPTPFKLIQNVLIKGRIIDSRSGSIYNDLRKLRNKVVHAEGYELEVEQAQEYVAISKRLRAYFDLLAKDNS